MTLYQSELATSNPKLESVCKNMLIEEYSYRKSNSESRSKRKPETDELRDNSQKMTESLINKRILQAVESIELMEL